ncbi:MAG: ATP-binding protein [Victivallales bacterium]|nr:ATP-binding protein [Victivallales bacterium]
MEEINLQGIKASQERRLKCLKGDFHRYLYSQIDWNSRLVCIIGARGTGKTTMLLQRIKEAFSASGCALYASLDNLWFTNNSLLDLVDYHVTHGGTHLFLDEVHYLEDWQTIIKNIYDDYPELSIVYTGSSLLKINRKKGDLSRRQRVYSLSGLSFREYLEFEGIVTLPPLSLEELHSNHVELGRKMASICKILNAFEKYLLQGYYPFYKGNEDGYGELVCEIVSQVLEGDYPAIEEVQPSTIRKARKMLMILAENPPQTPNFSKLCQELESDYKQGMKMLFTLERAGLLNLLEASGATLKNLSRPSKIYCENPNLMQALVPQASIGTIRECFFLNQLHISHQIVYPPQGDFLVDDTFLYEIGGRKKTFEQIKDIQNSFLAVDNTEIGHNNRIPLWCFGFLY